MTTNPARQPKGRPTGGQFAGKCNPEPADDELSGPQRWDFESASDAARSDDLPHDFDQWGLANKNGRTVAHFTALSGHLPADFNQWSLADRYGWTVAHEAAYSGHLPADFDQWTLADRNGRTVRAVADTAARR